MYLYTSTFKQGLHSFRVVKTYLVLEQKCDLTNNICVCQDYQYLEKKIGVDYLIVTSLHAFC